MRSVLGSLLLALLLSGCSLLEKAERYNASYAARQSLRQIEGELRASEPSGEPIRSLMLYDEAGQYTNALKELARNLSRREERIKAAFLSGDLITLQRTMGPPADREELRLLANMYLISEQPQGAQRLLPNDPVTKAGVAMALNQEQAIPLLDSLLLQGKELPQHHRLKAGRALLQLSPEARPEIYQTMAQLAENPWERFMLQALLGERSYHTSREKAFVTYLHSLKDSTQLVPAAQLVLAENDAPWRQRVLQNLRKRLLEAQHYPEALDTHRALSLSQQQVYPYFLLEEEEERIELIRRYEQPEIEEKRVNSMLARTPQTGTFRELWGNIPNVDNWAMEFSSHSLSSRQVPEADRPTQEEYEAALRHLAIAVRSEK